MTTEDDILFVVVQSYGDRSGIANVFGPYLDERQADEASRELRSIGLPGLFETLAMRTMRAAVAHTGGGA